MATVMPPPKPSYSPPNQLLSIKMLLLFTISSYSLQYQLLSINPVPLHQTSYSPSMLFLSTKPATLHQSCYSPLKPVTLHQNRFLIDATTSLLPGTKLNPSFIAAVSIHSSVQQYASQHRFLLTCRLYSSRLPFPNQPTTLPATRYPLPATRYFTRLSCCLRKVSGLTPYFFLNALLK